MTPGPKDDVDSTTLRALGRTRIEIVPRDAESVYVYWEVAKSADTGDTPDISFIIDIRREADDTTVASVSSSDRLEGEIVRVPSGDRYYATLALDTGSDPQRLARSSTSAGPSEAAGGDPRFVSVNPSDSGLNPEPTAAPGSKPVDWRWRGTESSNR